MSAKVDRAMFDTILRQQISLGRYANGQVADTVALLNAADKEIIAKLIARGDDGTFTSARLKALLKEIRGMVDASYWDAEKQLHAEMGGLALHSSEATVAMLATQVPVSFNIVGMSAEQLAAIVDKTPIAIGPDKKLLLEEIFQSLAAGKEEAIRGAVRLGMVAGEGMPEITRRIMGTRAAQYKDGILEIHRHHAANMVRSIVQATNNNAAAATFGKNSDIIKGWIYIGTLDGRTCQTCAKFYGRRYNLGEGPIPTLHVGCRCYQVPELKTFKELGVDLDEMPAGKKASAGGLVDASMTYPEWLATQSKATQVDILGPSRQKLYAEGVPVTSFTNDKGKLYNLDQLRLKQSEAFKAAFGG